MKVGEYKGKLPMGGMSKVYSALLAEVTHLIADSRRLLYQILMAVASDFFVELVKLGRDKN